MSLPFLVSALLGRGGGTKHQLLWGGPIDIAGDPSNAFASVSIERAGTVSLVGSSPGNNVDPDTWVTPRAFNVGDGYQIRLIRNSGNVPSGDSVNVWLDLSQDRTCSYSQSSIGENTGNFTAQLRRVGKTNIIAEFTFGMSAVVDNPGAG